MGNPAIWLSEQVLLQYFDFELPGYKGTLTRDVRLQALDLMERNYKSFDVGIFNSPPIYLEVGQYVFIPPNTNCTVNARAPTNEWLVLRGTSYKGKTSQSHKQRIFYIRPKNVLPDPEEELNREKRLKTGENPRETPPSTRLPLLRDPLEFEKETTPETPERPPTTPRNISPEANEKKPRTDERRSTVVRMSSRVYKVF